MMPTSRTSSFMIIGQGQGLSCCP